MPPVGNQKKYQVDKAVKDSYFHEPCKKQQGGTEWPLIR